MIRLYKYKAWVNIPDSEGDTRTIKGMVTVDASVCIEAVEYRIHEYIKKKHKVSGYEINDLTVTPIPHLD
jgi:hypothetical protein